MRICEWAVALYQENAPLVIAVGIAVWLLIAASVTSFFMHGMGMYAACSFIVTGGVTLTALLAECDLRAGAYAMTVLLFAEGIACFVLSLALACSNAREKAKKRRAQCARRVEYTLPDKDNSYVRARLSTTLRVPENETEYTPTQARGDEPEYAKTANREAVRLGYARKLLAQVKAAPLTPAERLETEEISRLFAFYLAKEKWNAAEVRAVNDLFSCLLKISAKYSVAV